MNRTVIVGDKEIAVAPLRVRQLAGVLGALAPLQKQWRREGKNADPLGLLMEHPHAIIQALACATNVELEWLEMQEIDATLELFVVAMEVNGDFLTRKLLPTVAGVAPAQNTDGNSKSTGM